MTDESPVAANEHIIHIAANTWARTSEPIRKVGFMDGASDGQKNTFQSSFDKGYKLGFNFGLKSGKKEAQFRMHNQQTPNELQLTDPRKLNCHICLDNSTAQDNVVNLYNKQKETNEEYFQNLEKAINK